MQKLLEVVKTPNKPNQDRNSMIQNGGDLCVSEQPSGLLTQEIGKDVLFGCESTNSRTGRHVNGPPFSQNCVPVSVERVDKDEDADKNVVADQTRTGRPEWTTNRFVHSARGNRH